ncbi:MAG: hypothetical protein WCZ89_08025 [Phycisphaerae bacterium]
MDTFWLKAVLLIAVIVAVVGAVVVWTSKGIEQAMTPETTFSDMVEKDKRDLLAEPNAADLTGQTSPITQTQELQTPPEPITFYFTELSEIEQIEAERLMAVIPSGRSIGRLPMTGFSLMVDTCRQIMNRWPGSIYDYKARRALNDMPEHHRDRYRIQPNELDMTFFTEPRPNTKPYTITEQEEY